MFELSTSSVHFLSKRYVFKVLARDHKCNGRLAEF